jgi:hypothetical protein
VFRGERLAVYRVGEQNPALIEPSKRHVLDIPVGFDPVILAVVQPVGPQKARLGVDNALAHQFGKVDAVPDNIADPAHRQIGLTRRAGALVEGFDPPLRQPLQILEAQRQRPLHQTPDVEPPLSDIDPRNAKMGEHEQVLLPSHRRDRLVRLVHEAPEIPRRVHRRGEGRLQRHGLVPEIIHYSP